MPKVSNDKAIEAYFKRDETKYSNNIFSENGVLYSYGRHFPMVKRLQYEEKEKTGIAYIVNSNRYSNTTAKQMSKLWRYLKADIFHINDCNINESNIKDNLKKIRELLNDADKRLVKYKKEGTKQRCAILRVKEGLETRRKELLDFSACLYGNNSRRFINDIK